MISLPGYTIADQIHLGKTTIVYRGVRERDQSPVVVKVHRSEYPEERELEKFQKEFLIGRSIEDAGIIKPLALEKFHNGFALILEDFGGVSLSQILAKKQVSLRAFLKIGTLLSRGLGEIHKNEIIHLDIKPRNIIMNLQSGRVAITDFGISTQLSRENPTIVSPENLEGTLAYMSPEQTGRMNRSIDYRSDIYSLGVTFYEMLAGRPPFDSGEAIEMVHNHIAVQPPPPFALNSEIPPVVSAIIMKMLAKNAEDRYQSAFGLEADLQECFARLKSEGEIVAFEPGTNDVSDRFQIPQKLYGREVESEQLLGAFESVSRGVREIAVVTGYSGIGKSALVHEIHKPVLERRGYFIDGKYDQFRRDIPYSSIIQAFRELVRQILTEDPDRIKQWKAKLEGLLGDNAQVIVDVIPEIEWVIGKQKAVPRLGPAENENRFNVVFSNFVRAVAGKEHPLVIFLDDMQWADLPSLKLIRSIASDPSLKYLFWIFSYRDNEVDDSHPMAEMIAGLNKLDVVVTGISLRPLSVENVRELILDTLHSAAHDEVPALAQLVHAKTNGNPFFVAEILKSLYQQKLIDFSRTQGGWRWDLDRIRNTGITDNVVELMSGKIAKLSEASQKIIRLASCIGNQFDLEILALVHEKSPHETAAILLEILKEGLIQPIGNDYKYLGSEDAGRANQRGGDRTPPIIRYKFLHDRVQQAAYSQLSQAEREKTHLIIGRHMLDRYQGGEREERLFDIVNHLNSATALLESRDERRLLIDLDLKAARKARASTAYEPAVRYLHAAIALLPANAWNSDYETMAALKGELADSANLSANFELSELIVNEILENATDLFDKVRAYEVRIRTLSSQAKLDRAWQEALKVLRMLGIRLPRNPTMAHVGPALLRTKAMIARRGKRYVMQAPRMTDPKKLAAMRILTDNSAMAYQLKFELLAMFIMTMTRLTYQYGNGPASPFSIAMYGLSLSGVLGDFKGGEGFGELALELDEKLGDYAAGLRGRTKMVFHNFIEHWTRPVNPQYFDELLEAGRLAVNTGDTEYAGYSLYFRSQNMFFTTGDLPTIRGELAKYTPQIETWGQQQPLIISNILSQVVENLSGDSEDILQLKGDFIEEEELMEFLESVSYISSKTYIHHHKAILYYLFGDARDALPRIEAAVRDAQSLVAMVEVPYLYFFRALILAKLADTAAKSERRSLVRGIRRDARRYRAWARSAPANHQGELDLIEAELARLTGDAELAAGRYDRAVQAARASGFLFLEALANQRAAEYYIARGQERFARTYLADAHYGYGRWGCPPMTEKLEREYPELLRRAYAADAPDAEADSGAIVGSPSQASNGDSSGETGSSLDIDSIMKASQTLSGEINLEKLLSKVLNIAIENAGAQRGVLLLEKNGELLIEAESGGQHEAPTVLQSIPLERSDAVPATIVQYVQRTLEDIVLGNASGEGRFMNSPYVLQRQPKSVLCTPITKQGNLVGVLYLENNLSANAFTPARFRILNVLSAQAAISIENARLYTNLEDKVEERTRALKQAKNQAELSRQLAEEERARSDRLLLNVLPHAVAEELKQNGAVQPRLYDSVTTMFTDFKGFTSVAERMSPEELVRQLDGMFLQFDQVVERHGIEKLKTIGDAYMCAAGLPEPNATHVIDVCRAALEILAFMNQAAELHTQIGEDFWRLRIGIHTGPVMAGVIGKNKFAYDVWGDTVNVASRMESGGEAGRINVSQSVYEVARHFFVMEHRGQLAVKNRGELDMYFLCRIRPELSGDEEGFTPGEAFQELYEKLRTGSFMPSGV